MKTMGDVHPHLLLDPRLAWLAAKEYPYPKPGDPGSFTVSTPAYTPEELASVAACVQRGGELPISAYPDGCCTGPTLHECRSMKGSIPGKVSTAECMECLSGRT